MIMLKMPLKDKKIIFSIETSCDETTMALVEAKGGVEKPRFKVLKNAVFSQIDKHREFGGVVPNIAKREHVKALPEMFKNFENLPDFNKAEMIAVTVGPGLEPALWTGIEFAKELGEKTGKKVFAGNHIKGHLFSFLLSNPKKIDSLFPSVALIVSGGHTILLLLDSVVRYRKLGETRDDAAGEAFDKGARLLGLPYPGGPELEKMAAKGNSEAVDFPRPMINQKNFDFSFSGLKTSLLYYLKGTHKADWKDINERAVSGLNTDIVQKKSSSKVPLKEDIAASYQKAIIDCLSAKTFRAAEKFGARSVIISGGVAANEALRNLFATEAKKRKLKFLAPEWEFNTDNAAMIAVSSYMEDMGGIARKIEADGNLSIFSNEKK